MATPTLDLKNLQLLFRDALSDEVASQRFATLIDDGALAAKDRIDTYRQSIQAAFLNCLRDTYSVCEKIVGEDFFAAMASEFIKKYPSTSENLNSYGELFADFTRNFKPAASLDYLADIARLEWAREQAYYGEDTHYCDFSALAQLTDEQQSQARLLLPPTASLIESSYPLLAIWNLAQAERVPESEHETVDLQQGGVKLFVFRENAQIRQEVLSSEQWLFLNACAKGLTIEKTFERLVGQGYHAEIDALLPDLVRRGFLVGFTIK